MAKSYGVGGGGWPERLYFHLLGLGVLSISIPISHPHPHPIPLSHPHPQSQSLDNLINTLKILAVFFLKIAFVFKIRISKSFETLEKNSFRTWVPVLESLSGNVDHKVRTLDYNEYANKNEDNDEGKINESASKAWGIRLFSRHGGEKTGFRGRQIRRKEAKVVSGLWVLDTEPLPLLVLEGACGRQKILEASADSLRRVTATCYWACCDMFRALGCRKWAALGFRVIGPWLKCDRPQVLVEETANVC